MLVVRWVNQVPPYAMFFAFLAIFAVNQSSLRLSRSCSQGQSQPKTPPVTQP